MRLTSVQRQLWVDNWPRRRRWMIVILVWMMANAQYLMIFAEPTAVVEQALVMLLGSIVAVIGSYVFGATWDDSNKRRYVAPRKPPAEEIEEFDLDTEGEDLPPSMRGGS